jgi:hypothetical protein
MLIWVLLLVILFQAKMLLEAFNKDRASLINSLQNGAQTTTPVTPAAPDARTQEMINEKLKKAEELGIYLLLANSQ